MDRQKNNEQVLEEAHENHKLIRQLDVDSSHFWGRNEKKETIELGDNWQDCGEKNRARQRSKYQDRLTTWHGKDKNTDLIYNSGDRVHLRYLTAGDYADMPHDDDATAFDEK